MFIILAKVEKIELNLNFNHLQKILHTSQNEQYLKFIRRNIVIGFLELITRILSKYWVFYGFISGIQVALLFSLILNVSFCVLIY